MRQSREKIALGSDRAQVGTIDRGKERHGVAEPRVVSDNQQRPLLRQPFTPARRKAARNLAYHQCPAAARPNGATMAS
ncbi:hypothetical protein HC891_18100 [Candidatus Gracilibacteria bacterium]|nr:hypothetical protein [Candidatus Gracilibacteria bacterium]